jgi:antirestriction protein ArdC
MVQGFQAWKKLGRNVIKGEKGIGIIAPMIGRKKDDDAQPDGASEKTVFGFKVVHVFDVSQTEGDDLPEFAEVSGDPGENIGAVERLIRSHGIELVYEVIPGGADGLSKKGTIVISPELQPAARLATLVHEISHLCGGHGYVAFAGGCYTPSDFGRSSSPHNWLRATAGIPSSLGLRARAWTW